MNRIELKGRDRSILKRLATSSNHNGNGNGNHNGNGRPKVAKKKTASTKAPETSDTPEAATIEAPVKVRVYRTVKKRHRDDEGNVVSEENQRTDDATPSQKGEAGDNLDWETIEVRKFVTEPAKVRFNFNLSPTIHYQGASAGCSVELPCYVEEIPDALVEAEEMVLAHLRPKVKELNATVNHLIKTKVDKEKELREKGLI